MAHPEQQEFIRLAVARLASETPLSRVIEIGSFDVNGEVRSLFRQFDLEEYVGVDLVEGPGVDIVSLGHELTLEPGVFDLAISVECFEHDQFWRESFAKMVELVGPGGWLVFSCAGRGRPEHGTSRSDPGLSPGTSSRGFEYYENRTAEDFIALCDVPRRFRSYQFITNDDVFDLYFIGQTVDGNERGVATTFVTDAQLQDLRRLTPRIHLLIRLPLRVMSRALPEKVYQEVAFRYWKVLNSTQQRFFNSRFSRS